jgi:hypothetical protein
MPPIDFDGRLLLRSSVPAAGLLPLLLLQLLLLLPCTTLPWWLLLLMPLLLVPLPTSGPSLLLPLLPREATPSPLHSLLPRPGSAPPLGDAGAATSNPGPAVPRPAPKSSGTHRSAGVDSSRSETIPLSVAHAGLGPCSPRLWPRCGPCPAAACSSRIAASRSSAKHRGRYNDQVCSSRPLSS